MRQLCSTATCALILGGPTCCIKLLLLIIDCSCSGAKIWNWKTYMGHSSHYSSTYVGQNRRGSRSPLLPCHDVRENSRPSLLPTDFSRRYLSPYCLHYDRDCGGVQCRVDALLGFRLSPNRKELGRYHYDWFMHQSTSRIFSQRDLEYHHRFRHFALTAPYDPRSSDALPSKSPPRHILLCGITVCLLDRPFMKAMGRQ